MAEQMDGWMHTPHSSVVSLKVIRSHRFADRIYRGHKGREDTLEIIAGNQVINPLCTNETGQHITVSWGHLIFNIIIDLTALTLLYEAT